MDPPSDHLSEEHRALLRFLVRVHQENGAKKLDAVAAEMHLKSRSRVSCLLRGHKGTLPANDAQLVALVRALGGGNDEAARGLQLFARARRSRNASTAVGRVLDRASRTGPTPDARSSAGVFVGRRQELEQAKIWAAHLAVGRGGAVMIQGEPGIGKSYLARTAAGAVEAAGCRVLWAVCDELSREIPLLPLLDAMPNDRLSAEIPRANLVAGNRTDLVVATMERMLARIDDICAESPTVLVVDDLQWADPVTVVTLGRLARLASQLPLLVVCLARPVPQREDLDALRRLVGRTATFTLPPLSGAEVAEFVRTVTGATPGPRLSRLTADTGGNPLYLVELLDGLRRDEALAASGGVVDIVGDRSPHSLAAAITNRLDFLSASTSEVIRGAALLGGDFSLSELAVVSGRRAADLLPAIDEAITAGVLRDGGQTLAFRHPLIRSTLYHRTPATVRTAWHRDAARSLADDGAAVEKVARQMLPALDEHGRMADPWAVRWLAAAGRELAGRAPDAAARLLRWALAATPVGVVPHALLVCCLADALYRVGTADEGAHVASAAMAHITDPDLIVDMLWTWTQCAAMRGDIREVHAGLERALSSSGIEPRHRARLLVLAARMQRGQGRTAEAAAHAAEALEVATSADDRWATAWALGVQSIIEGMRGRETEMLALAARAVALAEEDPTLADLRLMLLVNQAGALGDLDRHDDAITKAQQARRLAEESHNAIRLAQARCGLGELLFDTGRWDDALAELDTEPTGAQDRKVACIVFGIAAVIRLHRGDPAAHRHLADVAEYAAMLGDQLIGSLVLARSLEREQAGAPAEALAVLETGLTAKADEVEQNLVLSADTVRLAVAAGEYACAAGVVERAEHIARASTVPHRIAVALHCRGLHDHDPSTLLDAAGNYRAAGRPLPRAQALEAAARLLAERGERAPARTHLTEAFSIYGRLGAEHDVQRLRDISRLHDLRIRTAPGRASRQEGWKSLTPTELRVVDRVAQGASNAEISTHLGLSRRTVQVHISAAMAKLGLRSRADLIRHAQRRRR